MLSKEDKAAMHQQARESQGEVMAGFLLAIKVVLLSGLAAFVVGLVLCFLISLPVSPLAAFVIKFFCLLAFSWFGAYTGGQCLDIFMARRFGPDFKTVLTNHRRRVAVAATTTFVLQAAERVQQRGGDINDHRMVAAMATTADLYENVALVHKWLNTPRGERVDTPPLLPDAQWQQALLKTSQLISDLHDRPPAPAPAPAPEATVEVAPKKPTSPLN